MKEPEVGTTINDFDSWRQIEYYSFGTFHQRDVSESESQIPMRRPRSRAHAHYYPYISTLSLLFITVLDRYVYVDGPTRHCGAVLYKTVDQFH